MRPWAFVLLVIGGGFGAFAGSVIGAAWGSHTLFLGAILGGLIASPVAAFVAARFGLIDGARVKGTAVGAAFGFLAAATLAVSTLRSPVGPVLSTLLIGAGGLVGGMLQARFSSAPRP